MTYKGNPYPNFLLKGGLDIYIYTLQSVVIVGTDYLDIYTLQSVLIVGTDHLDMSQSGIDFWECIFYILFNFC